LHAGDVVNARTTEGGTAPEQVATQLAAARSRMAGLSAWIAAESERLPTLASVTAAS
jgi:hypothetical protein